jgi:mono/diheme cytochrome c family protein
MQAIRRSVGVATVSRPTARRARQGRPWTAIARAAACPVALVLALLLPQPLRAEPDKRATPAQLYRDSCAICHKNPRTLGATLRPRALADFLAVHYTASRASAAAIAAYLESLRRAERGDRSTSERRPARAAPN